MSGFWSSETLKQKLPDLIKPYREPHVVNCAYELSMGSQAWVTSSDQQASSISVDLSEGERVNIPPGQFAHLLIHEYVRIPNCAVGLLSMKSKVKMRGLVNVSGFHVDPGYEGHLVFAVFNAGSSAITIRQREATFLLWYVSLDNTTNDLYEGSRKEKADIASYQLMNLSGPTYNPTALAERVARLEQRRDWWQNITIGVIVAFVSLMVGLFLSRGVDLLQILIESIQ